MSFVCEHTNMEDKTVAGFHFYSFLKDLTFEM